jgi:release factor glutamine methyltransferase
MILGTVFEQAITRLPTPTARIDAEILLRHVLNISRAEFFLRLDQEIDAGAANTYFELIERSAAGEPSQYLTGHMEIYGLDFYVNSSVLIPRPETEIMIEKALEIGCTFGRPIIADVGCGSGAVAVTLAKLLPQSKIIALDISPTALKLTSRNAKRHECRNIELIESDLLDGAGDRHLDIICANLPYVPTKEAKGNRFEPQLALDGGSDGLNVIRRLVTQISNRADKPDWLLLEFGTSQSATIKAMLDEILHGSRTEIFRDLIPLDRISATNLSVI